VSFDGANDRMVVPDAAALDLTTGFSIEAWIRPATVPPAGSWGSVLTKAEAYSLQFNGPQLEFTVIRNGTRQRTQAPAGAVVAGQTYHVVGTYDGSTARLYINGALVASRGSTLTATATANALVLGSWDGWSEYYTGRIDEAAVYKTVLSAARVSTHYSAGKPAASASSARRIAPPADSRNVTRNHVARNVGPVRLSRKLKRALARNASREARGFCPLDLPVRG
jgi:hypothetical protein